VFLISYLVLCLRLAECGTLRAGGAGMHGANTLQRCICQRHRAAAVAALGAVSVLLTGCEEFLVEIKWTCTKLSTENLCLEWMQEGGVSPPSCFPGDATVITRTGLRRMDVLRLGEEVLGFNHRTGRREFSAVRAWLHRDTGAEVMMREVQTAAGSFAASSKHLLATSSAAGEISYEFADRLHAGHSLWAANGSIIDVQSVERTVSRGLYAPLTWSSNYFVGGPALNTSILAHSFAQVRDPRRYEGLWHLLLSAAELFVPALHTVSSEAYIHPIARISMRFSGAPVQGVYLNQRISNRGDEGLIYEDGPAAAERRLFQPGNTGQYGPGGGGSENNDEQSLLVLMSVLKTLPPFLSQGPYNSSAEKIPDYNLGEAEKVQEWLENGRKNQKVSLIVTTVLCTLLFCIVCIVSCCQIKQAAQGDTLFQE